MKVLAILHGSNVPPGVMGDEAEQRGHEIDTWSLAWGTPPPAPVDGYGAVMIFGGSMHADQDDRHPWLREESFFLQRLLDLHVPVLGVCLGAQLLAKAAHADVKAMPEPEVGWVDVELTDEAADDPVFAGLPDRFPAFQWHYYEFTPPSGASVLARSECCTQAFRLGDSVWGVQFHPEISREILEDWFAAEPDEVPGGPERFLAEYDRRSSEWESLGRTLCGNFIAAAERVAVTA
jgi:GMP synthase-like glutamine amidotransferase